MKNVYDIYQWQYFKIEIIISKKASDKQNKNDKIAYIFNIY